jgi:diguanylate cyclase (GGDEF)-like protein
MDTEQKDKLLLQQFEIHKEFVKIFLDAYVLLNLENRILKFNSAFCTVAGIKAVDLRRNKTLNQVIEIVCSNDNPGTQLSTQWQELLESKTPTRLDEVLFRKTSNEEPLKLIVGSYPFLDSDKKLLGTCLLMRDVTYEHNLQGKYEQKTQESVTDPLTQLYTRRYFDDFIDKHLTRSASEKEEPNLGILMFDLDKFKTINDTHGHQAGDFVLKETARILKLTARQTDVIGRYGGEEMLVVLANSSPMGTCFAAEKFRQAIEKHEYIFEGKRIPVTTSVGVTFFHSANESRDVVVARADKCLYEAKHNGRNVAYSDFGEGFQKIQPSILEIDDPFLLSA